MNKNKMLHSIFLLYFHFSKILYLIKFTLHYIKKFKVKFIYIYNLFLE